MVFITFPMRAERSDSTSARIELADSTASVYIVPDFFVFQMLHARWSQIDGLPVVSVFETPISGIDGALKRGFDIAVSLVLLALLAVPMAVIALLVKITSPGPILFKQKRYGLSGEEIGVWKFRSMTCCDNGANVQQATKNDSRITPLGGFCGRVRSTNFPSCSMSWRATCRWWGPGLTPRPTMRNTAS